MARLQPSIRPTETYTESNFLRLHTTPRSGDTHRAATLIATIEHLGAGMDSDGDGSFCRTIVDREEMTREDALFIARNYAAQHEIPVIYECHSEE